MSAPMTHWAAAYIGLPWIAGTSDCWSFARLVWRERWGIEVPPVPVDPQDPRAASRALSAPPEAQGFRPVEGPAEGDAVLMARGRHTCHVGIWIAPPDGPGVLHAILHPGVVFTPLPRLSTLGYRLSGFYRRGEP